MRIFVSSTFEDLREHRAAAIRVLRQLGHEVLAMEDLVAASSTPLVKVIEMVDRSDAYVGIFAWRYGHVPKPGDDQDMSPPMPDPPAPMTIPIVQGARYGTTSITHYEFLRAKERGIPILAFLLDERSPWPPGQIDGHDRRPSAPLDANQIRALRAQLQQQRVVAWFSTPEDLEARVAAAITMTGLSKQIDLAETVTLGFGPGSTPLTDTGGITIAQMIGNARSTQRVLKIDLADTWWSTRLFLAASLAERLTTIRRLLIVRRGQAGEGETHVGLVPTSTVITAIRALHPQLARFERLADRLTLPDDGQAAAMALMTEAWRPVFPGASNTASAPNLSEEQVQRTATQDLLERWLGYAMLPTAVTIADLKATSVVDLLLLVSYPSDLVPVSTMRPGTDGLRTQSAVDVVDKSSLNRRLALTYLQELKERARIL